MRKFGFLKPYLVLVIVASYCVHFSGAIFSSGASETSSDLTEISEIGNNVHNLASFKPLQLVFLDLQNKNQQIVESPHKISRKKRGIIWNKIKKATSGIFTVKKKIWTIKERAYRIIAGPDNNTPKPSYPSTGGSWGNVELQTKPKGVPLLSSSYGPPYGGYGSPTNSKGYGTSFPVSSRGQSAANSGGYSGGGGGYKNNGPSRFPRSHFGPSQQSSIKNRQFEDYGPPVNKEKSYKGMAVRFKI